MAAVQIKSIPASMMIAAYKKNAVELIRGLLKAGAYTDSRLFYVPGISQDAADEVFDLTNNPGRQDEREQVYGRGRSLSVGDIVVVYNPDFSVEQWLCKPCGWANINVDTE